MSIQIKDQFHQDLANNLAHLYNLSKLQMEIRDRWFRYYLILIGALNSLVAAFSTALLQVKNNDIIGPDSIKEMISALIWFDLITMLGLGFIFLLMYMAQIVNYNLYHHIITNIYDCYRKLYEVKIKILDLPNPFMFAYGRGFSSESLLQNLRSSHLYGAELLANLVIIFLNSLSIIALYFWWTRDSVEWPLRGKELLLVVLIFLLVSFMQVLLRQFVLAAMLKRTLRDLKETWK